jgi:hypothetical protein
MLLRPPVKNPYHPKRPGATLSARVEILNPMISGLYPANYIQTFASNGRPVPVAIQQDTQGYVWFDLVAPIRLAPSSMVAINFSFSQSFNESVLVEEVKLTPP